MWISFSGLEEDFDVITIDKADSWGGVWRFELGREKASHSGQVWQNLVTTSSAFVTSFSDFMPPEKSTGESHSEWAPFHMSHMTYRKFLADYINKFGISKCFRLHTTVKAVQDRKNGDAHAGYSVHVASTQDGKCVEDTLECDFVIVASGQHQSTKLPAIPGLQEFKASGGLVLHSTEYVDAKPFAGKRVLVIGAGDSGADLVKHISDVSAPGKTYISLRNGVHVLPRMGVESLRKGAAWTASDEAVPADYNIMRAQMYRPLHMRTKNLEMLPGTLKVVLVSICVVVISLSFAGASDGDEGPGHSVNFAPVHKPSTLLGGRRTIPPALYGRKCVCAKCDLGNLCTLAQR